MDAFWLRYRLVALVPGNNDLTISTWRGSLSVLHVGRARFDERGCAAAASAAANPAGRFRAGSATTTAVVPAAGTATTPASTAAAAARAAETRRAIMATSPWCMPERVATMAASSATVLRAARSAESVGAARAAVTAAVPTDSCAAGATIAGGVEVARSAAPASSAAGNNHSIGHGITALAHVRGAAAPAPGASAGVATTAQPTAVEASHAQPATTGSTLATNEDREFFPRCNRDRGLNRSTVAAGSSVVLAVGAAPAGTEGADRDYGHASRYFECLPMAGVRKGLVVRNLASAAIERRNRGRAASRVPSTSPQERNGNAYTQGVAATLKARHVNCSSLRGWTSNYPALRCRSLDTIVWLGTSRLRRTQTA
jgi:hypothetical protein